MTSSPPLFQTPPLLLARRIRKSYGRVQALVDVDVRVYPGEVLGIVGESGSGKSTLLRLLNLEEAPDAGEYFLNVPGYQGVNLFRLDRYQARLLRLKHLGIVYQNPHLGLRMRYTSSGNVVERLILVGERRYKALRQQAQRALEASDFPLDRMDDPPLRLSGGMQQRVQLAKAIALKPSLILLDEPTTGLDLSVQARVLDTIRRLRRDTGVTFVIVSHDLGVIRALAERVMVMKEGYVVEEGLVDQVLEDPQHPYTQELVHSSL